MTFLMFFRSHYLSFFKAVQRISHLQPHERIEWAQSHRNFGNHLFSQGEYLKAMDEYVTCLVALDRGDGTTHGELMDENFKLPILLNLSACMLKMGMFRKTEKICNLCLETIPCSWKNPKIFFRRGRARTGIGLYEGARSDYNRAINLLSSSASDDDDVEFETVHRAIKKLDVLIEDARQNHLTQKKAMQHLLGGKTTTIVKVSEIHDKHIFEKQEPYLKTPLYNEISAKKTRTYSKLKALQPSNPYDVPIERDLNSKNSKCEHTVPSLGLKQHFFTILACFIKFVLYLLGDEHHVDEL